MAYLAVTGCRGFLGHHLVHHLLEHGHYVYGIDAETYAGTAPLPEGHSRFIYRRADVVLLAALPDVDGIIHCAAETHVDNSLGDSHAFLYSNVFGTWRLLELARGKGAFRIPTFLHISTDEVLGPVRSGLAQPGDPLRPANPYAASKAAAEVLVQAWGRTHGVPWRIVRPTNLYGSGQYPEKLIPKTIRSLTLGRRMPIHGDGSARRCWLDVRDACEGIRLVWEKGQDGTIYQMAGNTEASVWEVASAIAVQMGQNPTQALERGFTRVALDERYGLDDSTMRELGWTPQGDFWRDLPGLVDLEKQGFRW